MITVTEAAKERITNILEYWKGTALRVAIKGGGCSGYMYEFTSETEIADDDLVVDQVVIDPISATMLDGATLDLQKDLVGEQFVVINPNASRQCGCGMSFS